MLAQKLKLLTGCLILFLWLVNQSVGDTWDPIDDTAESTTNALCPALITQTQGVHFLSASDTNDWFRLDLTAGTTYLFEAVGGSGSDDTEGELYQGLSGPKVAYNSDDGEGGVFNFLIVYTPAISGDYYLKVSEWDGLDAEYILSYGIVSDVWDPLDDTGAGATSRLIDEYEHSEGPHSLAGTDMNDWYRFSLNAGNTYRLESAGAWNTFGSLFSDSGGTVEVISDNDGVGDLNFKIDYTPVITGDYYLQVSQISNMQNGEEYAQYDLSYKLIEDEWDSVDDTGTGATELLPIDETIREHGPHALSSTDTNDWFELALVAGQTYYFESTGGSDTEAYLYSDSAGTIQVANNDDFQPVEVSSNFQIFYTPISSGTYYLKVKHSRAGQPAIYQLEYGIENDLDGDGMSDSWEAQYFGSTNALPNAHGDTDQFTNIEEYIAGTDPTNAASFFAVTNWSAGSFIVGWPSVAAREYKVLWAESLTNSFQQLGPMVDHPQSSYTDSLHNAEASGFYKVEVRLK